MGENNTVKISEEEALELLSERLRHLREKTDFFDTLFKTMGGYAIIATDFDGNIQTYNEEVITYYGYTHEEIVGGKMNIEVFFPKDFIETERLQQAIENTMTKGTYLFEEENVRRDGSRFPAQMLLALVKSKDGTMYGFIMIVQDLTERKRWEREIKKLNEELERRVVERTGQLGDTVKKLEAEVLIRKRAEEEIKEREAMLHIITASAGDAVMMIDDGGLITFWNKASEKMFGYTQDEALGKDIHRLIVPEKYYHDFVKGFKTFVETGKGAVIGKVLELEAKRKDGTEFYTEHSISAVKIKGKWHAIGLARDITERKQAEALLGKQKKELQTIIESSPVMIFYKDTENRFIRINKSLADAIGLSKEEVEGKSCMDIFPRLAEGYWKDDKEVIASGRPKVGIIEQIETKEGMRWVQTDKVPSVDEGGNIVGIIGFAVDITRRKEAEDGLQRSLEKLRKNLEDTASALSSSLEMRDAYTAGHARRVTLLACAIARETGLSADQIDGIRIAGVLHDIGKISIPAEILSKPGKLTKVEFELIKSHASAGYEILKDIEFPWPIAQIVSQHHEKMDGSGYPSGLSDDNILREARMLCVADVVEAMASHRPYRAALGIDAAIEEITQKRGIHYDPVIVDACVRLFKEKGFTFA